MSHEDLDRLIEKKISEALSRLREQIAADLEKAAPKPAPKRHVTRCGASTCEYCLEDCPPPAYGSTVGRRGGR